MSVTVTLHIYSGRPDPAWELSDQQAGELAERLRSIDRATLLKPPGLATGLGYRGFSINSVRERDLDPHVYIHQRIVDTDRFAVNRMADSVDLEHWLLGTADAAVSNPVRQAVTQQLSDASLADIQADVAASLVPPFDPGKWNNDTNIRTRNNCYNYANDKITNTFAQPGRGSGAMYAAMQCNDVGPAAQRDGQAPVAPPSTTPAQGHFVALVVWPDEDFHWYRQDSNTMWSHKPGSTPARNTDNSSALIADPRTCDRGNYTAFCGFFHCVPANTRIM